LEDRAAVNELWLLIPELWLRLSSAKLYVVSERPVVCNNPHQCDIGELSIKLEQQSFHF
jgi:hypothetical protein